MNYYEKVMILDPNLDDSAVEGTVEKVKNVILNEGGEIINTENWGRRKLSYELNKHQKGNYIILHFKSPPPTIAKLERLCKVVDPIIKFMIVRLHKKKHIDAILPSPAEATSKADVNEPKAPQEETAQTEEGVKQPEDKKDV
jgi:small subunit ribosomal protein S6